MVAPRSLLPALLAAASISTGPATAAEEASDGVELWGLEIQAPDVAATADFYATALGFTEVERGAPDAWAWLRLGPFHLLISHSALPAGPQSAPNAYLNLTVSDLATARTAVAAAGGAVVGPLESAVGPYLETRDPAGNPVHLIDHPWDADREADAPPTLFNVGLHAPDTASAEAFYERLGFAVSTREYLPETLVLERRGAGYLVVHPHATGTLERGTRAAALLVLGSPAAAAEALGDTVEQTVLASRDSEPILELRDPAGIPVRIGRWQPQAAARLPSGSAARAAFDRIASLAGTWQAASSKGWSDAVTFEVIARGSAVVQRTAFAEAPGNTMITVYHLDGDRLMLTHYCEARNQPRLVAVEIDDDRMAFDFLDATSLPSRDHGHMDRAVYTFDGPDRFSSRWTWYQDGAEGWLEEIAYRRAPDEAASAGR